MSTGVSWAVLNLIVHALRLFCGVTLGHGEIPERIAYARELRKLPVVLSADEIVRLLEVVASLKTRASLPTAHAAGLRASQTVGLKVGDIDSSRIVIRVEHGKGGKDRYVMLSAQLLAILRTYWRLTRPKTWLFPGRGETKPIDLQVLYSACLSATAAAGRWRDYRHHGEPKTMTLGADEFIRRFLLHTLPDGFRRIRHYGFLANGHCAEKLAFCREPGKACKC